MKRTLLLLATLILLLLIVFGSTHVFIYAQKGNAVAPLAVSGVWRTHPYDLLYTVALSSEQQPNGPLLVYRALGTDLRHVVPVIALRRDGLNVTPLLYPSPDGRYLALSTPLAGHLNTAALSLFSSDGRLQNQLLANGMTTNDNPIWSADSQTVYYHTVVAQSLAIPALLPQRVKGSTASRSATTLSSIEYDEIHRIDLSGHDSVLWRHMGDGSSLRLVGIDASGELIVTQARQQQAVTLVRIATASTKRMPMYRVFGQPFASLTTLPADITPGNVLRLVNNGTALECERVLSWQPLRYTLIDISLMTGAITGSQPLFKTPHDGTVTPFSVAPDHTVQVMAQTMQVRRDLAVQGIANVSAQEQVILRDVGPGTSLGASQRLTLLPGAQVVQAFWTTHSNVSQIQAVPRNILAGVLAFHKRITSGSNRNASTTQQDMWMVQGHAGLLADAPALPKMCYGNCPQGATGAPHVAAAILHGVAYTESNWHQFNTSDYHINGEAIGSPLESFDGGWGEFQQTWGMPPQCNAMHNCRADAAKVQNDQSYNIGVGIQSLISAWNGTAGVAGSDPNDPYKANQWFFAVWAYNGSYGNNPNDVASSVYGHWYPGAPFRSIYEEYVWYFAAHPQAWTANYLPSLGSSQLPPQSDFVQTSDSFVACVACTIPDWTNGSYDRDWVGVGAPNAPITSAFQALFQQAGGEDSVGLPYDMGNGASVHGWSTGWVQTFIGGSYQGGAILLANGSMTPYWVYGGVWSRYLADGGGAGCHGFPTSALVVYNDSSLGTDSYVRQTFQHGDMVWDATTRSIARDSCA